MRLYLFPFIILLLRSLSPAAWCDTSTTSVPYNTSVQGSFITALCPDTQNNVWVGTEDRGVSRYSPKTKKWTHFTSGDGLGDDNAYALCCDRQGRVWVGTLNHGVSVWNGKGWHTYDQTAGPLGVHVTALAVCPKDGNVWGGTEAGLFRYSPSSDTWTYYTRAHGLPSDQISALAFDAAGNIFAGTECDGLAIGSRASGYSTWRTVTGPPTSDSWAHGEVITSGGRNLPSDQVSGVLVVQDGAVYVGTDRGLARSLDGGEAWFYTRGRDYKAKAEQQYHKAAAVDSDTRGDLLAEDYVASLAQDGAGRVWVGHRTMGCEAFDPNTLKRVASSSAADFVTALAVGPDGSVLAGGYGAGLVTAANGSLLAPVKTNTAEKVSAYPSAAKPPTVARLREMLHMVKMLNASAAGTQAVFLGEDWATQGDWTGRYGRQYARLCAMQAPWGDHTPFAAEGYRAVHFLGPHSKNKDALRSWVHFVKTDNLKSLYDPQIGYRRQAEWDDHGEAYPQDFEGPDIWVDVSVPAGLHRVSLYFMNKDGHDGSNRVRDYHVLLRPFSGTPAAALNAPILAQGRVHNFWGGKYVQFAVRGPFKCSIQIAKNNSLNTIVSGVFIDKLTGSFAPFEDMGQVWMGDVRYNPSPVPEQPATSEQNKAALALWAALDAAWNSNSLFLQQPYRLLAYRAALAGKADDAQLTAWRWKLGLWTADDRTMFDQTMAKAYASLIDLHPALKNAKR